MLEGSSQEPDGGGRDGRELAIDPHSGLASSSDDAPPQHSSSSSSIYPQNADADGDSEASPVSQLGPVNNADDVLAARDAAYDGEGMASSHELQDFIDSALTDYASTTRSIGTRSPEVAPRTRRRRRTPLERAQAAVASLSLRDFNVLFQEMFVLRLASETLANGLPTEPARPSCSQASTASQGGPVGYGWPNSDHHPSSISAAALPPTSLANSFCGPDHDPELQTHRQLVDTRASTSTQDFVGSSSNFPQHPPPIYPQASGSSPTAPQGGPMGYGWRNSDHHLSSTSAAALSPTSLDNSSRGPGHDHQLETHRQLVNTRASTLTQDFAGSSSNYPQPTFPMYPQASGWLPHSIAPIPPRYCALCGTNHTPQWRKHPVLGSYVCNKCGHGDNFKDRPNKRKREHE